MSDRRTFLKTAGLLTAGAALWHPSQLFARTAGAAKKKAGSRPAVFKNVLRSLI